MQEKEYILKHKEIPVVVFRMNEENYNLLGVSEILEAQSLPFSIENGNNLAQCAIKLHTG